MACLVFFFNYQTSKGWDVKHYLDYRVDQTCRLFG